MLNEEDITAAVWIRVQTCIWVNCKDEIWRRLIAAALPELRDRINTLVNRATLTDTVLQILAVCRPRGSHDR